MYLQYGSNKEQFRQVLIQNIENLGNITSYTLANEFEFFADDIKMILTLPILNSYGNTSLKEE